MRRLAFKILFISIVACLMSCNNEPKFLEIKDEKMTIQLLEIKDKAETTELSYRLRLFPDQKLVERINQIQSSMWYRMDSAVYLEEGHKKAYPLIIQPVSNGIKNCFEFLIVFDEKKETSEKEVRLVYDDKYFTGKTFFLDINNN